ncbi:MAG TPA: hypothetical protein VF794_17065 [Archangium sp.]|jgi:mRNA-degrading endonuclease RelE of RelBE toxin-antitoxin system|uniref:hypothetical protein n=1 Tax=Archangium sp. TaxID=1872627 RepID=UPI002ED94BA0
MRRPESLSQYTVEVSATAWAQMGHLSLETYQRIREELESIASRLRPETPAPVLGKRFRTLETRSFIIEGHTALYDVDPERRRITLRGISPRAPQGK